MKKFFKKTACGIFFFSVLVGGFLLFASFIPRTQAQTGYTFLAPLPTNEKTTLTDLSDYLVYLYTAIIGLAIVFAVIMIVIGGIQYATAIIPSGKEEGKKRIGAAIGGLLLVLLSYLILLAINPELLRVGLNLPSVSLKIIGGGGGSPNTLCQTKASSCSVGSCETFDSPELCGNQESAVVATGIKNCSEFTNKDDVTCISRSCGSFSLNRAKGCVDEGGGGPGNHTCNPIASGFCSTENLTRELGGDSATARKMSIICNCESGGNPRENSGSDVCKHSPGREPFSVGLFQINLTVHCMNTSDGKCNSGLNCPNAFNGKNFSCTIKNRGLYDQCTEAGKDVSASMAKMVELVHSPLGLRHWSCASKCGVR